MATIVRQSHTDQVTNKAASQINGIKNRETAQYLADMVLELRNLAKSNNLLTLQGLLEVAFYEASGEANKVHIPPEELEHLRQLSKAGAG